MYQRSIYGVLIGMLLIVAMQRLREPPMPNVAVLPPPEPVRCEGEPIQVDYPFEGGFMDPHECIVQCRDQKQRYILYDDGMATQCEFLPGCNDWGEDRGITCMP